MKKKYIFRAFFVFLLLLIGAAIFTVEKILPYSSIKPMKRQSNATPNDVGLAYEPFAVKNDSVTIQGFYIPNDTAKATIICIHGISNCKENFISFAKKLHDIGCNVVLVDLRAHGKSGGQYCTFGYYEKYDIQKIIDFALSKSSVTNIGIHGHSLGGAVAIQTLELDNRLKFGIIESTYTTYEKVMSAYSKNYIGFQNDALTHRIALKSSKIAHFDIEKLKSVESCKNIHVPILMEHGTADERIPFSMGQENFAALSSKDKTFYAIENGGHVKVHASGGEKYWEVVRRFVERMEKGK
jgi:fermentation-respiration switch protein FrsA (DUF1100 family)